ncbi:aspartate carbamoyltransferase catalytic subunit [Ornithinibacillus halophilus]|uniref:Aspartate carbamoyltransferase n=1 Tax=Ornithinibacillus halophilus TaxID=930117 RepID=A0A1M5C5N2_9BACI|nr:aspartate carbamoyltransferase catalytic subunit [Ornithinibacillus halophilus]SHF49990.1 aspartate carbamoyltransferase [Ornithinibacillus halophilus]
MKHFLSVNQFSVDEILSILETASNYKKGYFPIQKQIFAANLFYEPSTRTTMSFNVAQRKLGFDVLDFSVDTSSVQKGESLYDTVKTFEAIGANILIVRHQDDHWYEELHSKLSIPLINAGAGKAEHPTQCMLDLLTIYEEFETFKGINVAICGDIKHSRVAKSNADALKRLGANVYFSAVPGFEDETLPYPYLSMNDAVQTCDVVMLLRIQHERHMYATTNECYLTHYGLTDSREKLMKKHAIIMHPAPVNRNIEIASNLVESKKSRIFKQMTNGVYVRMAIMTQLLKEWGIINEVIIKECEPIVT